MRKAWLPGLVTILLLVCGSAGATELWLFDEDDCEGDFRVLVDDEADLERIDFDDDADSFLVRSGHWYLYAEVQNGNSNDPWFRADPGGCVNFEDLRVDYLEDDELSAVAVEADPDALLDRAVIYLYDEAGFQGRYRVLTEDLEDFDRIGFEHRAASAIVINSEWDLFQYEDYELRDDRPSITLGPGEYPDLEQVPGYEAGAFPEDSLSSARGRVLVP